MMRVKSMVIHVLKNGLTVPSIEGKVITAEEFPEVYKVIRKIREREQREREGETDGTVCTSEASS